MKYSLKLLLILSLVSLSLSKSIAQNKIQNSEKEFGADTIQWKENSRLSFPDFKGKPSGSFEGNTYSGITLDFRQDEKGIHLTICCIFFCNFSFLKNVSENLLNHEQLHFDLTELYARKLRQQLLQKDFTKEKNIGAAIQKIYNEVNEELNKEQDRCDKETSHGIDSEKQKQWNENVQKQLKQLESFKENEIIIG